MLSELPSDAVRLLVAALGGGGPGETEHYAKLILDGTMKLDGDETIGMDVVDDTEAAEYLEQIRFIFAGRFKSSRRWWRPRCKVTGFGADDARYAERKLGIRSVPEDLHLPEHRKLFQAFTKARVEFYAGDDDRVFACGDDYVIFEPVSEPPHWWEEKHKSAKDALEDFLAAGRRVDEDGASHRRQLEPDEAVNVIADRRGAPETPDAEELAEIAARHAREDRQNELADVAYAAKIEDIRRRVVELAGADTFELKLNTGKILTVPRAPFVNWALGRTSLKHLVPPWKTVAPSGMKMCGDNPYHTDWTLGAGLKPESAYLAPISEAAYHEAFELQERLGNFQCAVLVDAGPVEGKIGGEIIVLPNLDPIHLEKLYQARGIITQAGGRLAHLAQVALERGVTILLVPDAIDRFPDGQAVTLNPAEGKIEIHVQRY